MPLELSDAWETAAENSSSESAIQGEATPSEQPIKREPLP